MLQRSSRDKKITIVGYYGYDNLGDDLMLDCLLESICENRPLLKVDVFAKESDNLKAICKKYKSVNYVLFKERDKFHNIRTYLRSIFFSSITIWGGGTCFSDEDGIGNYKYFFLNYLFRKKFAYVGIGVGNLNKKESISKTRFLLKKMAFASFRDKRSYDLAKSFTNNQHIYLTGDLSFLFTVKPKKSVLKKQANYILIGLRDLSSYYSQEIIRDRHKIIGKFIREEATSKKLKVIFSPIDSIKDKSVNELFAKKMQKEEPSISVELKESGDYQDKIELIANAQLNVSERLHSIVLSKLMNVNCLALSYSPKIDRFFTEIKDTRFISHTEDVTEKKLASIKETIDSQKENKIDSMTIKSLRESAIKNIEMLNKFL